MTADSLVRPHGPRRRSIRTRLLWLLLAISIIPMIVALGIGQLSTRLVGNRLTRKTQADLLADAQTRIVQSARSAALLAGSEAQQINLVALLQARVAAEEIERARASGASLGPGDVYLARDDFDQGGRAVPGLEVLPDGRRVSFQVPSIVTAPGVDLASVGTDLAALQALADEYITLRGSNPRLVDTQYTATAAGVHSSFPGHGGYPEGFDPRERPWYRITIENLAKNTEAPGRVRPEWGQPLVDATTGRIVVSVTVPIILRDGSIAGVTAVDMVLLSLIQYFQSEPSWTKNEELMIVLTQLRSRPIEDGLEIWAQQSYDTKGEDWRSQVSLEVFRLDDPAQSRALVAAVKRGESSVIRGTRNGTDILCAYAPILAGGDPTDAALVFTVPYADVIELAESIDDQFWNIIFAQLQTNAALAAVVAGIVVLIAFRGSRSITHPIRSLVEMVDRVAKGDLEARASVHTGDELEELADDFNSMIPKLSDRMKLRESLDLAMEVQQSLLPKSAPQFPGFDIEGQSLYCDETGGDYFDYLLIDRENGSRLAIAMGDVTGHGIAAALLMTTARALVRARAGVPGSLAEHITQINALLSADNEHGRFLTLFFLIVDREHGTMRYVAAGHDPAVIYSPATDSFRELDGEGGIPLGVDGSWQYEEHEAPIITPGEVLFLGTDGIWEARSPDGKMFGKDRMKQVIRANARRTSKELCDAMLDAVKAYRGDLPQLDDITMVSMKAV